MQSSEIRTILASAASFANENGHPEVSDLVVLLFLLELPAIRKMTDAFSGNSLRLRDDLFDKLNYLIADMLIGAEPERFGLSEALRAALSDAEAAALAAGKVEFDAFDLFHAFVTSDNTQAILKKHAITATAVGVYKDHRKHDDKDSGEEFNNFEIYNLRPDPVPLFEARQGDLSKVTAVGQFCEDLTEKARKGEIDPIFNRELEIERVIQILSRRKKNNPILIGEPGVGKTAVVEGLALRIAEGLVPERLKAARVMSLNVGLLIGGTKYRGEFEERISKLLQELAADRSVIMFIDEIHMITSKSSLGDAADLLKPALASGKLSCIGATTHGEYLEFEKDAALARRFQPVPVKEPTRDEAVEMLKGLVKTYREFHCIEYGDSVVEAAVDLSIRHIVRQRLPDKAIDVLDEAGARSKAKGRATVDVDMVREVVKAMSGGDGFRIPSQAELARLLKAEIQGQDAACDLIAGTMNRAALGLSKGVGSRSVMMFSGRKGTGRNHAIKALSKVTGLPIIQLDMAQYPDRASVTRLIGSPPGYTGFEQGGQMTEAIRRKPSALLVIDNMQGAYEEAADLVADVVIKGIIRDAAGRDIPCRDINVIFLSEEKETGGTFGFTRRDEDEADKSLPGGLANYVDADVQFANVDRDGMLSILTQLTDEFRSKLAMADIALTVDDDVLTDILERALKAGSVSGGIRTFRTKLQDAVYKLPLERGLSIAVVHDNDDIIARERNEAAA